MPIFSTRAFTKTKPVPQPDSAQIMQVPIDVDFPTAALAANDIIKLVEIPAGVRVQDYDIHFPQVDSGSGFTFSLGVLNAGGTDLATVYASGITAGRSNTVVRSVVTDLAQADATVARSLGLKVTAAATTYTGGSKTGQIVLALRG